MEKLAILILAAGLGKRMGGSEPKVLASLSGRPLLHYVLETAYELSPERVIVVTGYKSEAVESAALSFAGTHSPSPQFALQKEQLGTGHAVQCAIPALKGFTGTVLIMYGDVPLTRADTLRKLLATHRSDKATLSLVSLKTTADNSYGRVVRDDAGHVLRIVELRDCHGKDHLIDEFNSGIYAVDSAFLEPAIKELRNENAQKEYYLTDIVEQAVKEGQNVSALVTRVGEEVQGINDRYELSLVERVLLDRRRRKMIEGGVSLEDPASFFADPDVRVEAGARIGPNVVLRGNTTIESGAHLEGNAYLKNCIVKQGAELKCGVRAEDSTIGSATTVGPFAHLRPGTILEENVKIGNFVETKKAHLEKGAKASHLSYLGDCKVGQKANIGAGTIFCNYDGYNKFFTTIGAEVFVGSNSALVAPLNIGDGATIGAGSVITRDIDKDALAVTRASLITKQGWSKVKRERGK
jgi:bifunctional UDP-N-acetylglucosamine pyrophosphorylase/glucosamine-1-phosphate N-acetyltransferase